MNKRAQSDSPSFFSPQRERNTRKSAVVEPTRPTATMATEDVPAPKPNLEREFAESTSLHGIARVFGATRLLVRLMWIAIMLTCLGVCAWQISDRFLRFFQYKAVTSMSVEYVGDLDFPAVTICNFNRYRAGAMMPADLKVLPYILSYNTYDYGYYSDTGGDDIDFPSFWDSTDDASSFNFTEFTLRTGFLMDPDALVGCEWRGKNGSCSAANFSHVFTSYGNCWTFNSGTTGPILKESLSGSGNGVKMLIDIQQHEYTEMTSGNIEAGLKVLVHDQGTPPLVEAAGLAISPGVHAFIGVRRQEYLNLEPPYGKCDASKTLTRYQQYSSEGCIIECRTKAVLENCNCRRVRHPGNEEVCTPQQTSDCALPVIADLKKAEADPCACSIPCNYTTFTTSLSTATIPNTNVAQDLVDLYIKDYTQYSGKSSNGSSSESLLEDYEVELTKDYIQNNWILLDVYYEVINYEKFEQSEAISASALISDIGGQLGLFLGASFITLAEIFTYLGCKIESLVLKPRGKSEKNRTNDDVKLKDIH